MREYTEHEIRDLENFEEKVLKKLPKNIKVIVDSMFKLETVRYEIRDIVRFNLTDIMNMNNNEYDRPRVDTKISENILAHRSIIATSIKKMIYNATDDLTLEHARMFSYMMSTVWILLKCPLSDQTLMLDVANAEYERCSGSETPWIRT